MTTYWQNECDRGVCRSRLNGACRPCWLLKNCLVSSTSDTSATGTPSSRVTIRVSRSNASSAAESGKPVSASAARRAGFRKESVKGSIGARNNRTQPVHARLETARKSLFFKQFVQVAGTFLRCRGTRFRVRRSHQKESRIANSRRLQGDEDAVPVRCARPCEAVRDHRGN